MFEKISLFFAGFFLCYTRFVNKAAFRKIIYTYYKKYGRDFPWRIRSGKINPYDVLVSEVMLQQTQADRVVPKFKAFTKKFPTIRSLARADQSEVLKLWSGLGYNRRALNLHKAAKIIVEKYKGEIPKDKNTLMTLPSVGPYTAGAIRSFAYNIPDVFLETNIRTVFIHFFYSKRRTKISDNELLKTAEAVLDMKNPSSWYAALMDYGAMLKRTEGNNITKSKHYTKQKAFRGSDRALRGMLIRELIISSRTKAQLIKKSGYVPERVELQLKNLIKEGFIKSKGNRFTVK